MRRLLQAIRARLIRGSRNAEPLVRGIGKVRPLVDAKVILDHLASPIAEITKKIADSNGNSENRHAFFHPKMPDADRKAGHDSHIAKMIQAYNEAELEEKDVVVLKDWNFSEFVEKHRFVMVEFYSPCCGHCRAFAPKYAAAATELKGEDVVLAKVDMTQESELAQKYDLQGFGTLYFFVDGDHKPFLGKRTKDGIVTWIKKKIEPGVYNVITLEDAERISTSESKVVLGYRNSLVTVLPEFQQAAKHFKRKKCWTDKQRNTREQAAVAFYEFLKKDASFPFKLQKPTSPKSEVSDAKEVQESSSVSESVEDEL